jgi:lipoprotein-releasing system permease protein
MRVGAFVRMVAFRYLRARRQEGFISVIAIFSFLGIALGVAALIVTLSVMNGFTIDLLGRILGLGGHVAVEATRGRLVDFDKLADRIEKLPGILAARPVVEGQVLAAANGRATGALVRGLRESDLRSLLAGRLKADQLDQFADDRVLVGFRLAATLGVGPGDRITLTTGNPVGGALAVPRARSFPIDGLFSLDMPEYDGSVIFMPLAAAQAYFAMPDAVTKLELFVADPYRLESYEGEIAAVLGEGLHLSDWQKSNAALVDALRVERSVMFVILSLIVLVASFNIICGMIMLVRDKAQAIAILRTMGATRVMILRIFMLSGAMIGVAGTLAGFALGLAFAENMRAIQSLAERVFGTGIVATGLDFFSRVPARVDPVEVGLVLAIALGLSLLAAIYPSWRAARLDPVEALRYE